MSEPTVVLELARIEAAHLAGLVHQFGDLLRASARDNSDPALARLAPLAYDDDAAAQEFRQLTRNDLLDRRSADADAVLASLHDAAQISDDPEDPALLEAVEIRLDLPAAHAWLRTLAAVRLVLATRLGIADADDHHPDDDRYGIYDWVGYRLDGLVAALDRLT